MMSGKRKSEELEAGSSTSRDRKKQKVAAARTITVQQQAKNNVIAGSSKGPGAEKDSKSLSIQFLVSGRGVI
jgi:hypothetical protein